MKLSACLKSSTARRAACATLTVWIVAAGCGDDPFAIRWSENPDSVLLYSLARPELNLVSGFNFQTRLPITVEDPTSTGSWDAAVDTRDGRIVLLPPGALGITGRAGIAELEGTTFQEVLEAPQDTAAYTSSDPVQVRMGNVYVVRTNESLGGFGRRCVYYYKLEPLEIDPQRGTLRFVFDGSPVCNDFRLIPPD